jgi:hypothetical protein
VQPPKTTVFWLRWALAWGSSRKLRIACLAAVLGCAAALASRPRHRSDAPRDLASVVPVVVLAEPQSLSRVIAERPNAAPSSMTPPKREPAAPTDGVIPATPLEEDQAAQYLAGALHRVVGSRASENAVAVLWAHWAHETGRGKRMMGHNFAGIKGEGTLGGARVWTREATGTKKKLVRRTFRVYENPEQGALDYVNLLLTRYQGALSAAREGRTADFVHVLLKRGYYTDEKHVYERAITRLAQECRRRSLAQRALDSERNAGNCSCHVTPVKHEQPSSRAKKREWLGL